MFSSSDIQLLLVCNLIWYFVVAVGYSDFKEKCGITEFEADFRVAYV